MSWTERSPNYSQSTFGSDREGPHALGSNSKSGTASGLKLIDTAGTEYFLWVNSSGVLKISSTEADYTTNPNTAGTSVGSQ